MREIKVPGLQEYVDLKKLAPALGGSRGRGDGCARGKKRIKKLASRAGLPNLYARLSSSSLGKSQSRLPRANNTAGHAEAAMKTPTMVAAAIIAGAATQALAMD